MIIINLIKVWFIQIIDWLDRRYNPFEEFTRPVQQPDTISLAHKATMFEQAFQDFTIRQGTIYTYRQPLDLGDQALWHGVATAMWALKGDMEKVHLCLVGLRDQQPHGILCRGIDEAGNRQYETSNDQATGHLLGLYYAWKYGTPDIKTLSITLINAWAYNILEHTHSLINPDGTVTKYGKLIDGWKTDPLRLTLCLAIYVAAYEMTWDYTFLTVYRQLYDKYQLLVPYAKVKLWSWDTVYDTHRAAIHYHILNDLGYCSTKVNQGIRRLRYMVRKQANIWVNALLSVNSGTIDVLNEFHYSYSLYDNETINSTDTTIPKVWWGGEWCSKQPLPMWKKSPDDFCWQRNRYSMDKKGPAISRYTGLGFLAAYYLCLKKGYI